MASTRAKASCEVVPVGAGEADRQRNALSITDQMPFAPALGAVGGVRTGLRPATHRTHRTTVHDRAGPIDVAVAREPIQKREVHQVPDAFLLPIAQASPTRHARTAAQFLRQHLPRNPAAQDEQDASEAGAVRDARPSAIRSRRRNG